MIPIFFRVVRIMRIQEFLFHETKILKYGVEVINFTLVMFILTNFVSKEGKTDYLINIDLYFVVNVFSVEYLIVNVAEVDFFSEYSFLKIYLQHSIILFIIIYGLDIVV